MPHYVCILAIINNSFDLLKDKQVLSMILNIYFFFLKSTSNYHARRFGVRAAMPGFIAKKLCPHLTIVPLNFKKYKEVSKEVSYLLLLKSSLCQFNGFNLL